MTYWKQIERWYNLSLFFLTFYASIIWIFADVEFPVEWAPQPADPQTGQEETVYVYQLDPVKDAQEYKRVSDNFHQSCTNNIIKIDRVQNSTLYGTYAIYKQKMDKSKDRGSNEMCLFHGTKGPKCDLINHKGFNRSFCGENGGFIMAEYLKF